MGEAHGGKAAQVPRGLPALPRPDPCRTAASRNLSHGVSHWRARCRETGQPGSAGGRTEKGLRTAGTSPYGLPSRAQARSGRSAEPWDHTDLWRWRRPEPTVQGPGTAAKYSNAAATLIPRSSQHATTSRQGTPEKGEHSRQHRGCGGSGEQRGAMIHARHLDEAFVPAGRGGHEFRRCLR
jgi:hypothetical protein